MKKKNKSANTQLADDYFPLVVPPICWGSANTFFERSHIYAALTEWHKLEGHIRNKKNDPCKREIKKNTLFLSYLICNCII